MNYLNIQDEDEKIKNGNNLFNKGIIETLFHFSENEDNKTLNEMLLDLINFNNNINNLDYLSEQKDKINYKHSLYKNLQKNIMEIIYIKDKNKKEDMINKIYIWYKDKIKLFDELKYIKIKSYFSPEEYDDEKYINEKYKDLFEERKKYISQTEREKIELRHRSLHCYNKQSIEGFNNYRRKHILKGINNKKLFSKINLGKRVCGPLKRQNFILDSKNEIINKNDDINLPFLNYSILKANKIIIENKQKLLAEKRSQEETKKKINEYGMNKAKFKTNLISKYEIKELINNYTKNNNFKSVLLKKYKNNKNNNKMKNDKNEYSLNDNFILKKNEDEDEIYENNNNYVEESEYDHHLSDKNINDILELKRKLRKSQTQKINAIPKELFKKMGNKVITQDIKNLDYKTNLIKDNNNDQIIYKTITVKYPDKKDNRELVNICLNKEQIPHDSISKLTMHNDIFKQKLLYKRFLNISHEKSNNYCNYTLGKNLFGDDYEFINNKFENENTLSPYSDTNIGEMKKIQNIINFSEKKRNNNVKIYKINNNYNLYKDNYLNLRKSISHFRKKEYKQILNLSKKKQNNDIINQTNISNNINNYENKLPKKISKDILEEKILFKNKIININKNQNNLSAALLNPNESSTFSRYYLPRPGNMLLSK